MSVSMPGARREAEGLEESKPRGAHKKRVVSSKYDVYKVKIWLGDSKDHYYVLSRFLISRSLTITKIPSTKAVKIALELKKYLVDHDVMEIKQSEMEDILFGLMRAKGYGDEHIHCYKTVSAFYQLRQPLVIIICGAPCTGKSTIAQQLAARLNMPNVMQTDVISELMRSETTGPLPLQPPWSRTDLPPGSGALVAAFQAECALVRRALEGDFTKALQDGKPLIVEGCQLDPGQLLPELQERGIVLLPLEQAMTPASSARALSTLRGHGSQGLPPPPPSTRPSLQTPPQPPPQHPPPSMPPLPPPQQQHQLMPSPLAGPLAAPQHPAASGLPPNASAEAPQAPEPRADGGDAVVLPPSAFAAGPPASPLATPVSSLGGASDSGVGTLQPSLASSLLPLQPVDGSSKAPEVAAGAAAPPVQECLQQPHGHPAHHQPSRFATAAAAAATAAAVAVDGVNAPDGGLLCREEDERPKEQLSPLQLGSHATAGASWGAPSSGAAAASSLLPQQHSSSLRGAVSSGAGGGGGVPKHVSFLGAVRSAPDDEGAGGAAERLEARAGAHAAGHQQLRHGSHGRADRQRLRLRLTDPSMAGAAGADAADAAAAAAAAAGQAAWGQGGAGAGASTGREEEEEGSGFSDDDAEGDGAEGDRSGGSSPGPGPRPGGAPGVAAGGLQASQLRPADSVEHRSASVWGSPDSSSTREVRFELSEMHSDTNNYGDADTDGVSSGLASPDRDSGPGPGPRRAAAGAGGGGGGSGGGGLQRQSSSALRRVVSQPAMAPTHDDAAASLSSTAAAAAAAGGDGPPPAPASPLDGRLLAPSSTTPAVLTTAAATSPSSSAATPALVHPHISQVQVQAQTPGRRGFSRCGSLGGALNYADMAHVRSSLAGILRLSSNVARPGLGSPLLAKAGSSRDDSSILALGDKPRAWSGAFARSPLGGPAGLRNRSPSAAGLLQSDASAAAEAHDEASASAAAAADAASAGALLGNASAAAADAAPAEPPPMVLPPLFVPVVLRMDEADHRLATEDNLAATVPHHHHSHTPSQQQLPPPPPQQQPQAAPKQAPAAAGEQLPSAAQPLAPGEGDQHQHQQAATGLQLPAAAAPADGATAELSVPVPAAAGAAASLEPVQATAAVLPSVPSPQPVTLGLPLEEVLERAQAIQDYLCDFESQGLPVLTVQYGNFGEALDVLHEYVLMCIQAAMDWVYESKGLECD